MLPRNRIKLADRMVAVDADSSTTAFSETELLAAYNKLINIRDDVVAKRVPAVKQGNHVAKSANSRSVAGPASATNLPSSHLLNGIPEPLPTINNAPAPSPKLQVPNTRLNVSDTKASSIQKPPTSTSKSSGIDPIFLTKSTVLVKAEIYQKRQRLEKVLEEQLHRSQKQKAIDQDALPDFDVTDVFRKAQELVKPTQMLGSNRANGVASSSDSFDENTFYSSQMDESTTTEEVDESQKRRPHRICKFFLRGVHCRYGQSCTFSHDPALKRKLEAESSQAMTFERINADQQASSRQDAALDKRSRRNESQPKPTSKETYDEQSSSRSQAERERRERIARLEAELRSAKAEEGPIPDSLPRLQEKETNGPQEEPTYSPPGPDEFGRDVGLRRTGQRQAVDLPQRRTPVDGRQIREFNRHDVNVASPLQNSVRVVTNHIRSPVAPQPSRVSPLAVAKVPQVSQAQRNQGENGHMSRTSNAGNLSIGQSPVVVSQPRSSKKRRRGRDSGEHLRNVIPRTDFGTPGIRVKEEPISPPPLHLADNERRHVQPRQEVTKQPYIDTAAVHRHDEQSTLYHSRPVERPINGRLNDGRGPQTPPMRRIISRNGQRYIANEEPELRRVVTAPRQLRAPMSPAPYPVQYSAPQPRGTRATSQVYASPAGQAPPYQNQASAQPHHPVYIAQDRSPSPVRRLPQPPSERHPTTMAPPPRRIIVDQYGNEFMEAPIHVERHPSVTSVAREIEYDPRYERVIPRDVSLARQPQFVRMSDDSQYVRRAASPIPNGFFEVPTKKIIGSRGYPYDEGPYITRNNGALAGEHSGTLPVSRYEEVPEQDARIVRMHSARPVENQHEQEPISDERIIRMQSVRPMKDEYNGAREQLVRIQSVRPEQPRIIKLGERQEPGRQAIRQGSVLPDIGDYRPVSHAAEERPKRQYAPQVLHGGYVQEIHDDSGLYHAQGSEAGRGTQRI